MSNPVLKLRGTLAARAPRALLGLQDDGGGRGRLFSVLLLRLESSFVFSIKFGVDKPSVQTDNSEPLSEMYQHFTGIKGGETFCLISRFDAFHDSNNGEHQIQYFSLTMYSSPILVEAITSVET